MLIIIRITLLALIWSLPKFWLQEENSPSSYQ